MMRVVSAQHVINVSLRPTKINQLLFWSLSSQHYDLRPISCYQIWQDQPYPVALPVPYARDVEIQQFSKMPKCGIKTEIVDDLFIRVENAENSEAGQMEKESPIRIHVACVINPAGGGKAAGKSSAEDSLIVLQVTVLFLWKRLSRFLSLLCLSCRMEHDDARAGIEYIILSFHPKAVSK
jgi:hypothetical protein